MGWSAAEGKANGQQGWQVFVEGMEGKLPCEMNFRDALRAIRYSFLLAKKLNLRINEVQLAALSLDYQQAKEVAKAQVAEAATEVAQEVAAEAPVILFDGTPLYEFKIVLLDKCIRKLVASGKKVCLRDIFKGEDDLEVFKAMVEAEQALLTHGSSVNFFVFGFVVS